MKDYIGRINDTILYINDNLDIELNLSILSKVALYSPFHFHRLFTSIVRETPNEFITRIRIEKATSDLVKNKSLSIAEVFPKYGFSSHAAFSKSFKKYHGISPSELKKKSIPFSKIRQINSKNGQKEFQIDTYICTIDNYINWIKMNAKIEVKRMPSLDIAYVSHVGAFHLIGDAFKKLMRWATPNGLAQHETITVYHDDPNITDISQVRQAAGVILISPMETRGEVSTMQLNSGRYAVGTFELSYADFEKAWQSMFVWINEQGYEATSDDCYQIYKNSPKQTMADKSLVEIYVPVK